VAQLIEDERRMSEAEKAAMERETAKYGTMLFRKRKIPAGECVAM